MSKHVKGQISLYIDGMLKDAELKAFETHVKTCGECANALAGTRRAVAAAGKTKEQPLPVNFYAKLNQKLDAVDAEKGVFNWPVFMRSAAAICTMLIVGIFVYNIKNQTNNFSDVRMKQDSQMPKEQANAIAAAVSKPAVMQQKKKAGAPEGAAAKDKLAMDVDMKKVTDDVGYVQEAAPVVKKAEAMKVTEEKASLMKTRSAQAPAPAAKMKMMEASAGSGGMVSMAEADSAAPLAEEEANEMLQPNESGPQTFVFKDEKAWRSYAAGNGVKEPGTIDWTQQMAVAVFLSARPTEGYWVEIVNVEFSSDRVIVYYREHEPMLGSINAQVITYPHREKVVKKSELPVEFKEVK